MATKRKEAKCPLCKFSRPYPFPYSASEARWGDCGCNARDWCYYHKWGDEPLPERPTQDVLEERARQMTIGAIDRWVEKNTRAFRFNQFIIDVKKALPIIESDNSNIAETISEFIKDYDL